jgi:hypothetical protein
MPKPHPVIRFMLRWIGTVELLALPCALMPYAWMDAVHRGLGLGQLPGEPIVGYLARSASGLYAIGGGMLWLVSTDLARYRPVLVYLGAAFVTFGLLLLGVDYKEGLPVWWIAGEGSIDISLGAIFLLFARQIARACREEPAR